MAKFTRDEVCSVQDESFQPTHLTFTRTQFGVRAPVNRSFQAAWFNYFKWIHHDFGQDSVYCFVCCKAVKERKADVSAHAEENFLMKGFEGCHQIFG